MDVRLSLSKERLRAKLFILLKNKAGAKSELTWAISLIEMERDGDYGS